MSNELVSANTSPIDVDQLPIFPRATRIALPSEEREQVFAPRAQVEPEIEIPASRIQSVEPEVTYFHCPSCGEKLSFQGDVSLCEGGPCPKCFCMVVPAALMTSNWASRQLTPLPIHSYRQRIEEEVFPVAEQPKENLGRPSRHLMKVEFVVTPDDSILPY